MKTIGFINNKGGVGKTTDTVHIGAGLAIRGKRVLVIDGDAQGHATIQLGLKKWGGVYRLLAQEEEWKRVLATPAEAIWAGDYRVEGKLYVLPGNIETRAIPFVIDMDQQVGLLRERLHEMRKHIDVVVIDTSPTASAFHSLVYAAADYILMPTEAQRLSFDGLNESLKQLTGVNEARDKQHLDPAQLLGVIPMKVRDTTAHKYGVEQLIEKFDAALIYPQTTLLTVYEDANWAQKLLYAYAPEHHATKEMWSIVDRVQQVV